MFTVTIARFELYPLDEPTGYCVGFNVTLSNGRSFYRDTVVPLEKASNKNDEEIVQEAWNMLEADILAEVDRLKSKSPVVGQVWTPPTPSSAGD